jgi:hypothetical protein
MRILLVGDMTPFVTTSARVDAFRALGFSVETVDYRVFVQSGSRLGTRLNHWTLLTPNIFGLNRAIREGVRRFKPDVVWIEKGTYVFPRTLRRLSEDPSLTLVYHNTDDWKLKSRLLRIHWRYLLRSLSLYDVHITSNLHNVEEYRAMGFPHVHHMELAANTAVRDPGPIPPEEKCALGGPAGFIGHWEPNTERALAHLARAGIPLKIYGGGWNRRRMASELGECIQRRFVWGDEYARAICSFEVNIGIVSQVNRNHTASRTFQIPALGGFLLHERNDVVTKHFREGVEADFFGSDDELVEKCRYYLAHPEERLRIAEAGRRRCVESGYFEIDRMREIIPFLEERVRKNAGRR